MGNHQQRRTRRGAKSQAHKIPAAPPRGGHMLGLLTPATLGLRGPWPPTSGTLSHSHLTSQEINSHRLGDRRQLTADRGMSCAPTVGNRRRGAAHSVDLHSGCTLRLFSVPLSTTQTFYFAINNGFFHILLIRL